MKAYPLATAVIASIALILCAVLPMWVFWSTYYNGYFDQICIGSPGQEDVIDSLQTRIEYLERTQVQSQIDDLRHQLKHCIETTEMGDQAMRVCDDYVKTANENGIIRVRPE